MINIKKSKKKILKNNTSELIKGSLQRPVLLRYVLKNENKNLTHTKLKRDPFYLNDRLIQILE